MKLETKRTDHEGGAASRAVSLGAAGQKDGGFTLVEVMVVIVLTTISIVGCFGGILSMKLNSNRLADHTAMMAIVEARMEDLRAATYNPPNYPFKSTTLVITNNSSIDLDKVGATFLVPGSLVTTIQPVAAGHLVTVKGTFMSPNIPISVTLQSVVNKYSGGVQ